MMEDRPYRPPKIAEWMLKNLMPGYLGFSALGDYEEIYERIAEQESIWKARLWYWGQVAKALPHSFYWGGVMFRSYLKITFRNMRRQKMYSSINIAGLSIGIACTLLIFLWVQDEVSYDRFHKNAKNIFRVISEDVSQGGFTSGTPAPLAPALKEFPDIKKTVRFRWRTRAIIKQEDKIFYERRGVGVDPSFFDVFTFPLIRGNPRTALDEPQDIVISEDLSQKYFGIENPMDKNLEVDGKLLKVSGVLKDIPLNSHIHINFLTAFQFMEELQHVQTASWNKWWFETYVLLEENVEDRQASQKIAGVLNLHRSKDEAKYRLFLQPITKIHLHNLEGGGPIKYVYIYSLISFFVLSIACINFMNLSTARSSRRTREVGLRKVLGSNRYQLIKQFLGESLVLVFIAYVVAIFIVYLTLPSFNRLVEKELPLDYSRPGMILGLLAVLVFTGIIAGSYPAFYLSSFSPVTVLKRIPTKASLFKIRIDPKKTTGASFLRKILVLIQFSLSIGLIICTVVVSQQLNFMRNADMGLNRDSLVWIPVDENMQDKIELMKNEWSQNADILGATVLGIGNHGADIQWEGMKPELESIENHMNYQMVDFDFFKTTGASVIAGRTFSRDYPSDLKEAYILDEEAVKLMELESPVGKYLSLNGKNGTIIGVMRNIHINKKSDLQPVIIYLSPNLSWDRHNEMFVRINKSNIPSAIAALEKTWKKMNPNIPFEYAFFDEIIDNQYRPEMRLNSLFNYVTYLAIFISCLGLFGLAAFMVEQRTKEIGIRRVLGASGGHIVLLLSGEFVKWVVAANIISWPVAYAVMHRWLQSYPYRVNIMIWTFLLAGTLALVIAFLTISYQAIKAARTDPVDALRYE